MKINGKIVNKKVPSAVLACFIILFFIQGLLKIFGVFIFEKALDWKIFELIDNSFILNIIYWSVINFIAVYCLSFSLTDKCYSNKWYHYLIIGIISFTITLLKFLITTSIQVQYLYDFIMYILTPIVVNITTDKENKINLDNKLTTIVITISIQIILYFCYLGLCYWSSLLNSIILINQTTVYASTALLIFFEEYVGLICLLLSMNILIYNFNKGGNKK